MKTKDHSRNGKVGMPLILASASPRRRELVRLLGRPHRVASADIDETPEAGELPDALTQRLATKKALTIARRATIGKGLVLAADTIVVLDGTILNKPKDQHDALLMLTGLRGRDHRVLTGLALTVRGQLAWSSVVETTVWMRSYALQEMARYVASGLPLDKAGGYGIQDGAFKPVERIDGCYTNVVGLPLCEVELALATVEPLLTSDEPVVAVQRGTVPGSCSELCRQAQEQSPWLVAE
jgi:septum formation protein